MNRILIPICAALLLVGCNSAYFGMMESLGWHKRDLLVDRVKEARDEQQEAKEEFASALDQFMQVMQVEGGELEDQYRQLQQAYERSDEQAQQVREQVESVENVAEALFEEWEDELDQYQSGRLRDASEDQLRQTRQRYEELIEAMHSAEAKMEPVLLAFHDQVLFLKHNLNAQAIASLQTTATQIESDVAQLIEEMEASIRQADQFIAQMGQE